MFTNYNLQKQAARFNFFGRRTKPAAPTSGGAPKPVETPSGGAPKPVETPSGGGPKPVEAADAADAESIPKPSRRKRGLLYTVGAGVGVPAAGLGSIGLYSATQERPYRTFKQILGLNQDANQTRKNFENLIYGREDFNPDAANTYTNRLEYDPNSDSDEQEYIWKLMEAGYSESQAVHMAAQARIEQARAKEQQAREYNGINVKDVDDYRLTMQEYYKKNPLEAAIMHYEQSRGVRYSEAEKQVIREYMRRHYPNGADFEFGAANSWDKSPYEYIATEGFHNMPGVFDGNDSNARENQFYDQAFKPEWEGNGPVDQDIIPDWIDSGN